MNTTKIVFGTLLAIAIIVATHVKALPTPTTVKQPPNVVTQYISYTNYMYVRTFSTVWSTNNYNVTNWYNVTNVWSLPFNLTVVDVNDLYVHTTNKAIWQP